MVETLLANEAHRKKEQELKNQQADKLAETRKELKTMSADDLKKRLLKRGLEVTSKKDEMVEALFLVAVQDNAINMRQAELKSKSLPELKELLSRYRLEAGSKEHMIKTMLAYEARCRDNLKAFETSICEAVTQKKAQLDKETNTALKDMCAAKGLPVGGGKDDRI